MSTVVVGLSGGIDSSVTALLLKEAGYNVIGIHLQLWVDPLVTDSYEDSKCCSVENILRTRKVADKLGIPFYNIDIIDDFKAKVVDYYLESYKKAITPNPCIVCNREIKFGLVLEKLQDFGADFWATGHYVKKIQKGENFFLEMPKDREKDQTYFLYTLTQEKLSKSLFPLGDYKKSEVKEIAKKFDIQSFKEEYVESQNLCFYPEHKPNDFLDRYLKEDMKKEGFIKTLDEKIVGKHQGMYHYTIGQRRGLNLGGSENKLYVVGKSDKENTVYVGEEKDLFKDTCTLEDVSFTDGIFPEKLENLDIKIRYTKIPTRGSIQRKKDTTYEIKFDAPVRAITPGQYGVFYQQDIMIGGGMIIK